jgi:hypothetical protein
MLQTLTLNFLPACPKNSATGPTFAKKRIEFDIGKPTKIV